MGRLLQLLTVLAAGWALGVGAVEIKRPVETGFANLQGLTFEEAKEVVQPLLSPDGKLGYVASRGLLIIYDYPERIQAVKEALKGIDRAAVNIRVDVTFDERGVDVDVRGVGVRTGDGHTRVGGNVGVTAVDTRRDAVAVTTQFVVTREGRPAQIWVGETVADPVWVFRYGARHGWWHQEVVWQQLGASLWVLPRLMGDGNVEVSVYPRVTMRGAESNSVVVRELTTTVVAADGEPVSLGGLDKERQEVYRYLLGIGKLFDGNRLAITLTSRVQKRPPARIEVDPDAKERPAK